MRLCCTIVAGICAGAEQNEERFDFYFSTFKGIVVEIAMKSQEDVVLFCFLFICRDSLSFFLEDVIHFFFVEILRLLCGERFFFFLFICRDSLPFVRWQWKRGRPGVLCHFLASPPVAPNIRGLSWP